MDGAKGEKGDSGEKGEHGDPGPAVSFFLYLTCVNTNLPYSNFPNAGFISLFFFLRVSLVPQGSLAYPVPKERR